MRNRSKPLNARVYPLRFTCIIIVFLHHRHAQKSDGLQWSLYRLLRLLFELRSGASTTALGADRSGESKNWTLNNMTTASQSTDYP